MLSIVFVDLTETLPRATGIDPYVVMFVVIDI